ncbi:MAG: ferritin-like domain-containing protein [Planctomycetes bacterium]|nr:ferritin-like domain-containing protein [Planctomycetota bacterium]
MAMNNLQDALLDELRDLYSAEKQILKALPRMAKAAENPELKKAFETHERQTEEQVTRLEQVFDLLDHKPRAKKCQAMEGMIEESKELMKEDAEPEVLDAMLIASAQKVEHYEIASYGTACTWAETVGCDQKAIDLLKQTLSEEKETDELLTQLAEQSVNVAATS